MEYGHNIATVQLLLWAGPCIPLATTDPMIVVAYMTGPDSRLDSRHVAMQLGSGLTTMLQIANATCILQQHVTEFMVQGTGKYKKINLG